MNGLLGKITKIRTLKARGRSVGRRHRLEVSFTAACVMPGRTKAPFWLKDQVLKVIREVADPRETGGTGDSIVLTPAESAKWLFPLIVDPAVTYGRIPPKIRITLRWWKDKKPPEFTVCANGRRKRGRLIRRGKVLSTSVPTGYFFDGEPTLPVGFSVSFDKLTADCSVLPEDPPFDCRVRTVYGERHRVESLWYALDICADQCGGGISMLREKGRGNDHFRTDDSLIHGVFNRSGHIDRVRFGWAEKMDDVKMTSCAARREGRTTRLCLEGVLDKGRNIHTSVAYTVFDNLPLIIVNRDVMLHKKGEKDDKGEDKKGDEKPREPIDRMESVSLGFRAAYLAEKDGAAGSRVLSVDEERFSVIRYAQMHDRLRNTWRLTKGWAIMEHPIRRESMMYLFDTRSAPLVNVQLVEGMVALAPNWLPLPVKAETGAGFTLAIVAGELCGAGSTGAWVACRRPLQGAGVECAVVGRFREGLENLTVDIRIGGRELTAPLERLLLPGVGEIHVASARVYKARMKSKFDVTAGGVPARRIK